MPTFIYTAKSEPSKIIKGDIEAESEQDAVNKLTRMGYFPVTIKAGDLTLDKQGVKRVVRIPRREVVLFTRQLSTLIESGVNIINALNIILNQASNRYFRAILKDIISKIKDGKPLSESLRHYPHTFSNLYTAMISSGEAGGNLEQVLKRLAEFMEKEEEFKNSLRASLTYPLFVFMVSVLTVIVLLVFVIPRLVAMFEDMGQVLPLPTKILINISGFSRSYWWLILAIIFIFIFLLRQMYRRPKGRIILDNLKLKAPVLGGVILKSEISRMMRTLSFLVSAGIAIISAMDIAISVMENQILKIEVERFKGRIADGLSLSQCLGGSKLFPAFVTNIVMIGEETGKLDSSLLRIADDYEKEVDRSLKALTRLLEPVIILVMGLVVGFIVLSMLLPIFQINLIVR